MAEQAAPSVAETLLASALALARKGFRVFPLEVDGKRPAHEGWQASASTDENAVTRLWTDPFGELVPYNIGVATGQGLVVVDVDTKDGRAGADSLEALVMMDLDDHAFTVRTASGGLHLYYACGEQRIRNSVSQVMPGIDIRGEGGYVVAPGSTIGEKSYSIELDIPPAALQPWFADMCGRAPTKGELAREPLVELDDTAAIERAKHWLVHEAPEIIAGSGNGDHTGYAVACRLKDFGISEHMIVVLGVEHFPEAKSPNGGTEPAKWEQWASNAYKHSQNAAGVANPLAEFDVVELEQLDGGSASGDWPSATPLTPFDPVALPRRQWIVRNTFGRRFTSAIIAPGGMGKTQFILQTAIAVAAGRGDIIGRTVIERTPVWYWNQEDDLDELRRRIAAIMQHFGVTWDDLVLDGKPMLYIDSGVERPLTIAKRGDNEDEANPTPQVAHIKRTIKERGIGLFIVDPLAELHKVKENSNEQMRQVWEILRRIAVECDCATAAGAHTRKPDGASSKGHTSDINSLRGAGSQAGVVRTAMTLLDMSDTDGKKYGVKAEDRGRYVRLDDAKANLFLKGDKATWYERTGVMVGGFDGQEVGVLAPVELERAEMPEDGPDAPQGVRMVPWNHPLHHLAEMLATRFPEGGWHWLSEAVSALSESAQRPFGSAKNAARKIDAIFCGQNEAPTEFGIIERVTRDKVGTKVRLRPEAQADLPQTLPRKDHEEEAKSLEIRTESSSSSPSSEDEG